MYQVCTNLSVIQTTILYYFEMLFPLLGELLFNLHVTMILVIVSSSFAAPDEFRHVKPQPSVKDGIARVKSEIKGVMGVMQNNISKVLDRGAKLEDLQDKSGTAAQHENTMKCVLILEETFSNLHIFRVMIEDVM